MSAADDFLRQAGVQKPTAAPTLAQQFQAQATAPAPAQQPEQQGGWLDELGHQIGLTGRAAVTGITSLPAIVGDALNSGINMGTSAINKVAGTNIPQMKMPSQVIQSAEDKVFPSPRNATERVVQDATAAGFGLGPTFIAGKALTGAASPTAQALGRTLTAVPGNQIAAAASSGGASSGAKEAGLGPGWQLAAGLTGGVGGSLAASGLSSMARRAQAAVITPEPRPEMAAPAVDSLLETSPLPASSDRADTLKTRTQSILANEPAADPGAAARAADAQQIGMKLTLGQVTRDPSLFAQEQNWRGLPAGRQLLSKFNSQNSQLATALDNTVGSGGEAYKDGKAIVQSLASIDEAMQKQVSSAYKEAAQSSGAKLNVPLNGVAQDYANVLQNFGDKVPSGVRNNFEALGLQTGMQKKVFGIDDAENLLKNINANRSNDPATNTALGQLSQSVKKAVLSADDEGGVFAFPREMAAQRFALRDKIPALADAADGLIAPEDFTKKYLMNGDVDHVNALAELLSKEAPKTLDIARGQVGNELRTAAFGENLAGDKSFAPERFAKALRNFGGTEKLAGLYGPEATDDLYTIGRVGSYIHSEPSFSPVNRSNTGSALLDMAEGIPMVGKAISAVGKRQMIARALQGKLSDTSVMAPSSNALAEAMMRNTVGPVVAPLHQDQR